MDVLAMDAGGCQALVHVGARTHVATFLHPHLYRYPPLDHVPLDIELQASLDKTIAIMLASESMSTIIILSDADATLMECLLALTPEPPTPAAAILTRRQKGSSRMREFILDIIMHDSIRIYVLHALSCFFFWLLQPPTLAQSHLDQDKNGMAKCHYDLAGKIVASSMGKRCSRSWIISHVRAIKIRILLMHHHPHPHPHHHHHHHRMQ